MTSKKYMFGDEKEEYLLPIYTIQFLKGDLVVFYSQSNESRMYTWLVLETVQFDINNEMCLCNRFEKKLFFCLGEWMGQKEHLNNITLHDETYLIRDGEKHLMKEFCEEKPDWRETYKEITEKYGESIVG